MVRGIKVRWDLSRCRRMGRGLIGVGKFEREDGRRVIIFRNVFLVKIFRE